MAARLAFVTDTNSSMPFEWHPHPIYELTLTRNSRGWRVICDHIGQTTYNLHVNFCQHRSYRRLDTIRGTILTRANGGLSARIGLGSIELSRNRVELRRGPGPAQRIDTVEQRQVRPQRREVAKE